MKTVRIKLLMAAIQINPLSIQKIEDLPRAGGAAGYGSQAVGGA